jgi:hypothetical protein
MQVLNSLVSRRSSADGIPVGVTTLSVGWFGKQLIALAVHRGVVAGTWTASEIDENDFTELLRQAVAGTGYRGKTVSLVLAHPRLVQQLLDVPQVKGAVLRRVIQRQAEQQKIFAGEAVWDYQEAVSSKGSRIVLHLFPKELLDRFTQGCARNGLHLVSAVPVSAILQQQATKIGLEKTDVALLAGDTGGLTSTVVCKGDGQLILARTIAITGSDGPDRCGLDLNRTSAYSTQQSGVIINQGILLFGSAPDKQAAALQPHVQLPICPAPVKADEAFWLRESLKLKAENTPNFITPMMQKAPQRRQFARVVAVGAAALVLGCLGVSAFLIQQTRQELASLEPLRSRVTQLQAQRQEMASKYGELERKEQILTMVVDNRLPPVPAWVLGYISDVVPSNLVVTNLNVKWQNSHWRLQLAGTAQNVPGSAPGAFASSVSTLNERLIKGPLHLTPVVGQGKPAPKSSSGNAFSEWIAQVGLSTPARPISETQFQIEGIVQ